jgi:hypothetical protein
MNLFHSGAQAVLDSVATWFERERQEKSGKFMPSVLVDIGTCRRLIFLNRDRLR